MEFDGINFLFHKYLTSIFLILTSRENLRCSIRCAKSVYFFECFGRDFDRETFSRDFNKQIKKSCGEKWTVLRTNCGFEGIESSRICFDSQFQEKKLTIKMAKMENILMLCIFISCGFNLASSASSQSVSVEFNKKISRENKRIQSPVEYFFSE